MLNPWPVVD